MSVAASPADVVLPASQRAAQPCLVLGIGNTLLGDDGVGVRVMEQLQRHYGGEAAVFVDGGTLAFNLLASVQDADALLVVDAAELQLAPGSVRSFEGDAMDRFLKMPRRRSVHEVGLIDLLDMARLVDCLPARRALICIQPLTTSWSETLSAPVDAALAPACATASAILKRWEAT